MRTSRHARSALAGLVSAAIVAALAAAATVPAAASSAPTASGTPAPSAATPPASVAALVRRMTPEEKVGQLFVQQVYGSDATTPDRRNVPLYGVARPADVVAKYHLGGVVHFGWTGGLRDARQIATLDNGLQRAALGSGARVPLTVATDQEQGSVTRLPRPATRLPGAMGLGAGGSTADARTAARITGAELRAVGITSNYAPDADVNVDPANPVIGVRSFGADPRLVAGMVAAQVAGFQRDANVGAVVKHFPGHGDTRVDSHTGLPVIRHSRATWNRLDAPPFRAAIAAGADTVMTGHLVVPALDRTGAPATLSKPILTGVLRRELGFTGVVVSDSLAMKGVRTRYGDGEVAVRAIDAGVDQLLMAPNMDLAYRSVLAAVRSGRIPAARLDASVTRILALKQKRGLLARPYVPAASAARAVGTAAHRAQAQAVADRGVTLVRKDAAALPFRARGARVLVAGYGSEDVGAIAGELTRRGAAASTAVTGAAPSTARIRAVAVRARGARLVVVTTADAGLAAHAGQRRLVAALRASGARVVVVGVRGPYDVSALPGVRTYLAAYSGDETSARAAARVLVGAVRPTGRLPVAVPTADGRRTLYRLGHGLTR